MEHVSPLRKAVEALPAISEAEKRVCLSILDALLERMDCAQRGVWTYRTLAKWSGFDEVDATFQDCIQLLVVHPRIRALDMHLLFFNPNIPGDIGTPLSAEEEKFALRSNGFYVDRDSGKKVPDYKSHLVPYFVPAANLEADARG
ncbi:MULTISPECIES: hypothetical protein [Stenotrophomonas]|uniref:hypothetical protein n=1 Tax=Stenotrophomonas TaxID=40323 RepID=UPI0011305009|nr:MULTISPECIES: hypothetical protein [Stenotrophomonas]MCU1176659.1 hypothetical protein [Stenotrophomonas maltophilia]MRE90951.1 hypothetical protein [Stenotrophomonas sp. M37]MRF22103.1 hypothetical protein [Stenotrophomonas sp. MY18]MRF51605.1 hypothetical protein [Stenotrophomonas sp. MY15]MRG13866.1 hypothetical protein [Stenotrophomonas sp. MY17]